MAKNRGERIFQIGLGILSLGILVGSLQLGLGAAKDPGSGLFPFFCGLLILAFSSLAMVFGSGKRPHGPFNAYAFKRFSLMALCFTSWILLIQFAGYFLTTIATTYSFSKILGLEGWRKPLLLSVGTAALCYFLFDFYLNIDLPRWPLG